MPVAASVGDRFIVMRGNGRMDTAAIVWMDPAHLFEEAFKTGKPVLIDFYTDWCGWCKKMDATTYADDNVVAYVNERFLAAKVNPEESGQIGFDAETYTFAQFAQILGVTSYPTSVLLLPESIEGGGITAAPIVGYVESGDFLMILRFYAEKAYGTMSFREFVAAQQ